jgi:hypothetical protein
MVEGPANVVGFETRHENVAGADLCFAEEERGIVPAAIEHVDNRVGDARHFGFVLAEAIDHAREVGHQTRAIDLVVVRQKAEIVAILLQNVKQPMRQLDIAIAGALGVAQGLYESIISGAVELARDRF